VTAEASVATSGDTETGASSVDMAFTQVHSGCVVQSGSQSFTFDGSPSVVVEISWEFDGESVASYGGSIEGGLDYEFDGRSGHCAISYEYSGTTNTSTGSASASLTGSVCGVSMSYEYEVG
ncbi:MAG TPA: hypothetical protein VFQ22_08635, partial [Longimicrobiales bacterium]|nr:hypothetical protein [Longimicrobiales bacterium]